MEKKEVSGKDAVMRLLHAYGERNNDEVLNLLTDDIFWIGTAAHEHRFGKEAVSALLKDDLSKDSTPYDIEIVDCKEVIIYPGVFKVFVLTHSCPRGNIDFMMESRSTYLCVETENGPKISSWHCSLATELQAEGEYFPISFAENIVKKATQDVLTHIMNRASFEETIQTYLKKEKDGFAFILIDLDNFKFVNDRYGHHSGDEVLIFVAEQLKKSFAETDIIARLGGDEFVAFIPFVSNKEEVQKKVECFIKGISSTLYFDAQAYIPSASVGIYICKNNQGIHYEQCYKAADAAMYKAKNSMKSTWHTNSKD